MTEKKPIKGLEHYEDAARALVVAEVEDVLTRTAADAPPSQEYQDAMTAVVRMDAGEVTAVLVETAALAGELVVRLAAARGEDPRETWAWLLSTEWHRAE